MNIFYGIRTEHFYIGYKYNKTPINNHYELTSNYLQTRIRIYQSIDYRIFFFYQRETTSTLRRIICFITII